MNFICAIDDVAEDSSKGFDVDGQKLIVVRSHGYVRVYRNMCPHTGGWLNRTGDNLLSDDGSTIQCAIHRALFQFEDGLCVQGPCTGKSLEPLHFLLEDGKIWLLEGLS